MRNPILNTDSYKLSHYLQYPPGTRAVSAYVEARKGGDMDHVLFFGLQMFLLDYLTERVTAADIDEAESITIAHGLPFNRDGWERIVKKHRGHLPLKIEALPEGSVVPAGIPLVQVRTTDPQLFWLATYIETALLRAIWYPSTVATVSWGVKQTIRDALEKSAEPDVARAVLPFTLHDFGARGTTSFEQAGIGGLAHLVNFMGTDTLTALSYARAFYDEPMAGFSIPAAEHSTMTAWGEEGEPEAFRNMLRRFGGPGKLVAVVSDSYDIYRAVRQTWGDTLKEEVRQMGGTVVVRPDSGDPTVVPIDVIDMLGEAYGFTINAKGYKVLDPAVRVIQGDGVNPESIKVILERLLAKGWSAENIAFGMGAALLQKVNRDTLRFAMKANAREDASGQWHDLAKSPKTDPGKASKAGRLAVFRDKDGAYGWCRREDLGSRENLLKPVWRDGELLHRTTLADVRALAEESSMSRAA
ncbi:MAG: nicotinate phosphoribosyltransferase [Hyphomicrobiaceae bacterium]|nr:nicotinate phosphoribosyltransferase [Hyphomicrobiaceae bacterium]